MYGLTLGESKTLMLKYLDEYSVGGETISPAENADYLNRHNAFADSVQISLAQLFPLSKQHQINQHSLEGMIVAGGFDLVEKEPGTDFILQAQGPGAYYFEVCGTASIQVEERVGGAWNLLQTWENQGGEFCAYRDNLTPSSENAMIRLRFAGAYPYLIKNAALYRHAFPSQAEVPPCRPWIRYEMPADFLRLDEVIVEERENYLPSSLYYWENDRVLVLPHDLTAAVTVRYWAYPEKIDQNTPDSYVFPLRPEVARLIPLKVAALVIPMEKRELSQRLLQLYEQELVRIRNEKVADARQIESVYQM